MSIILAALLQVSPTLAPVITTGSRVGAYAPGIAARDEKPYVIEVDASAGGQSLWRGSLRVASRTNANFQRNLSEAPPERCTAGDEDSRSSSVRDAFNVSISAYSNDTGPARQNVNVEWQRPSNDCASATIQRTVRVSGTVYLEIGKPLTIEGDGGLVVRLTRR